MEFDLQSGKLESNITMMDVLGHFLIWLLLILITGGLALLFWPYAAVKLILNSITLRDRKDMRVGTIRCDLSAGSQIGHMILWFFIVILTAGLAYPFYFFGVCRTAINKAVLVP